MNKKSIPAGLLAQPNETEFTSTKMHVDLYADVLYILLRPNRIYLLSQMHKPPKLYDTQDFSDLPSQFENGHICLLGKKYLRMDTAHIC